MGRDGIGGGGTVRVQALPESQRGEKEHRCRGGKGCGEVREYHGRLPELLHSPGCVRRVRAKSPHPALRATLSRRERGKMIGPMRNLEISFIFNQIADLLEIQGANPFRIRAYRRAAANIEGLADNIETLALNGTLRNVSGIGEDLANKIAEYIRTGSIQFHEQLKLEVPL